MVVSLIARTDKAASCTSYVHVCEQRSVLRLPEPRWNCAYVFTMIPWPQVSLWERDGRGLAHAIRQGQGPLPSSAIKRAIMAGIHSPKLGCILTDNVKEKNPADKNGNTAISKC